MKRTEYYEVEKKDFIEAHGEVKNLLDEKFGTDYDGDSNVEFFLIDRQRCEKMHFGCQRYEHKTSLDEALRDAMFNMSIAYDKLSTLFRIKQSRDLDKTI